MLNKNNLLSRSFGIISLRSLRLCERIFKTNKAYGFFVVLSIKTFIKIDFFISIL